MGSSGCGKSTLAKLISGLYKPWSGEILFDGRPIESISSDELTNSIAVVDQNIVLFDDTLSQNIRMWDQRASRISPSSWHAATHRYTATS